MSNACRPSNGRDLSSTANPQLSQVCDVMLTLATTQANLLKEHYSQFPATRRDEIQRLGSALWREVCAVQEDALAIEAALNEPAFVAFKQGLLARPRPLRKKLMERSRRSTVCSKGVADGL